MAKLINKHNGGVSVVRRPIAQPQDVIETLLPTYPEFALARRLLGSMWPVMPETSFIPSVELSEKDGNYLIDVALPGFKKEDIEIEASGNELTISGKYEHKEEDTKKQYSEMRQASFTRTIALPKDLDANKVTATFKDGILRITAPPTAPINAKKVQISTS